MCILHAVPVCGNFQSFETIKQEIRNDLQELENIIYPKLQEIESS